MSPDNFDKKVWRALRILAEDGPAYQMERQPLTPIVPLIECGFAFVCERRMTRFGMEEEVRISSAGMTAHKARGDYAPSL